MFQTVTAVLPRPIGSPTACASGPVTTSATARAPPQDGARVTTSCSGRSFQKGRPSGLVDHVRGPDEGADVARGRPERARRPTIRAPAPAAVADHRPRSVPRKAAAESGPIEVTMSVMCSWSISGRRPARPSRRGRSAPGTAPARRSRSAPRPSRSGCLPGTRWRSASAWRTRRSSPRLRSGDSRAGTALCALALAVSLRALALGLGPLSCVGCHGSPPLSSGSSQRKSSLLTAPRRGVSRSLVTLGLPHWGRG